MPHAAELPCRREPSAIHPELLMEDPLPRDPLIRNPAAALDLGTGQSVENEGRDQAMDRRRSSLPRIAFLGPEQGPFEQILRRALIELEVLYEASAAVLVPDRIRPDVDGTADLTQRSIKAGARRIVLISSTEINEPSHRHPGHLSERQLRTQHPSNGIARRWMQLEQRVRETIHEASGSESDASIELIVLRPTAMPVPGGKDLWSRVVSGRVSAVPAGFDPPIQWLKPEALARAIHRMTSDLPTGQSTEGSGIFNVVPSEVVPLRAALRAQGVLAIALPVPLLKLLHRLTGREPDAIDYLRYPWTASGRSLERCLEEPSPSQATLADPPSLLELASDPDPGTSTADATAARVTAPAISVLKTGSAELATTPRHDPFGMDTQYIDRLGKTLFRFLHDAYWRIEWRGLEHIPTEGRAVLTGVHRGHQPWDGVMILHRLVQSLGRHPRFLIHPALVKHPFLAPYMTKCGGIHACRENGDWVLSRDELLAIFPEGIRGAFTHYREAYELKKFGRHDFVKFALRNQAPIVPFVVLGSAEIFPILAKIQWSWWQRQSEWPCLPITPTLSLLPLPSKWHVLFLEPLHVQRSYGPEAAEDSALVRSLSDEVRARMQHALRTLLSRRKHIFWGSIFDDPEWKTDLAQTKEATA